MHGIKPMYGPFGDFADEAEVTIGLKEHVWKELAPIASSAAMTGSEKYEAAAKVAEWPTLASVMEALQVQLGRLQDVIRTASTERRPGASQSRSSSLTLSTPSDSTPCSFR